MYQLPGSIMAPPLAMIEGHFQDSKRVNHAPLIRLFVPFFFATRMVRSEVCCRGSVFDATASSFTKAFYRARPAQAEGVQRRSGGQ